jgi:hypothetical protein
MLKRLDAAPVLRAMLGVADLLGLDALSMETGIPADVLDDFRVALESDSVRIEFVLTDIDGDGVLDASVSTGPSEGAGRQAQPLTRSQIRRADRRARRAAKRAAKRGE